jgi:hypothetical protein
MAMDKRRIMAATTIALIFGLLAAGILVLNFAGGQEAVSKLYSYHVSTGDKTYLITVRTNWTSEPKVDLSPETDTLKFVSVDFSGWSKEAVFFNITIPNNLLGGNISLIRKYYELSPDQYILSNNGTHNSVQMTCVFTPYFSGVGHFEIRGTEGAW